MNLCPICHKNISIPQKSFFFICPDCKSFLHNGKDGLVQADEKMRSEEFLRKNWLTKKFCEYVLHHRWSDEGYLVPTSEKFCNKTRVCTNCFQAYVISREHDFSSEYVSEGSCDKRIFCTKCHYSREVTADHLIHEFGEWVASEIKKCTFKRTCKRCGEIDQKVEHTGRWLQKGTITTGDDGEKYYLEYRKCEICGHEETRKIHSDSPWS